MPKFTPIGHVRAGVHTVKASSKFTPISHIKAGVTPHDKTAVEPEKKGGGFLHGLEHAVTQGAADLRDTALHAPGGLAEVGKAVALDTKENLTGHPEKANHSLGLLKGVAVSTAATVEHPL